MWTVTKASASFFPLLILGAELVLLLIEVATFLPERVR